MKNNIKMILEGKEISIRKLSKKWGKPYAYTHQLVNREDISSIPIGTLTEVAELLEVDIKDLYKD